jgi:hypothetical protein
MFPGVLSSIMTAYVLLNSLLVSPTTRARDSREWSLLFSFSDSIANDSPRTPSKSHALELLSPEESVHSIPDAPTDLEVQQAFSRLPIHRSILADDFDWPRRGQLSYLCERIDYFIDRTVMRRDFGPWIASHHTRWRCLVQSNEMMLWDNGNCPVDIAEVIIDKWREHPSDSIGEELPRVQFSDTAKTSIWFESSFGFRRIHSRTVFDILCPALSRFDHGNFGIWSSTP